MTRKTKDEMLELIRDREACIEDLNKTVSRLRSAVDSGTNNVQYFHLAFEAQISKTEAAMSRASRAERRVVLLLDQIEALCAANSASRNEEKAHE